MMPVVRNKAGRRGITVVALVLPGVVHHADHGETDVESHDEEDERRQEAYQGQIEPTRA